MEVGAAAAAAAPAQGLPPLPSATPEPPPGEEAHSMASCILAAAIRSYTGSMSPRASPSAAAAPHPLPPSAPTGSRTSYAEGPLGSRPALAGDTSVTPRSQYRDCRWPGDRGTTCCWLLLNPGAACIRLGWVPG